MPVLAGEFPDDWTWDDKADVRAEHAALEGKPMPKLNLDGWINGTVTASDIKGKVIIGVCTSGNGQEQLPQTVKTRSIEYPVARDPQLASQSNWHVHYYPTYAIVDRKGIVRIVGLQPDNVETVVKKLLDEPAPKS